MNSPQPTCPTCEAPVESLSRYMDGGPAFVEPCGHFVVVIRAEPIRLETHEYGDLREQDLDSRCWEFWRLTTSRGGRRVAGNPPLQWLSGWVRSPRAS